MTRRRIQIGQSLLLVAAASLLLATGCSPPDDRRCSPECGETYTCDRDEGVCRPKSLDSYRGTVPGRRLVSDLVDGRVYAAAIAPAERLVVAGRPGKPSSMRVLDRLARGATPAVALDTSDKRVAVAWSDAENRFRVALRKSDEWAVSDPVSIGPGSNYRVTQHFDVAVGEDGHVHLVFRDRLTGGLQHLYRTASGWTLQTIDDGEARRGSSGCQSDQADPTRSGVGYEPDVEFGAQTLYVSYYDARCGNLRLAHRTDNGWVVRVVDTGDFSIGAQSVRQPGDVGRFSSLVVNPSGDVAVAYHDQRRGRLLYATESDDEFDVQLVDPGVQLDSFSQKRKQIVGAFADLAFRRVENRNIPYIAYLNGSENRLRLAYRIQTSNQGGRWIHRTLEPDPPTGFFARVEVTAGSDVVVLSEKLDVTPSGASSRLVSEHPDGR